MLGRAVCRVCARRHAVTGVDLPDGDLSEANVVTALCHRLRPEWILHTAAFTDVDGAESQAERALAVNAGATEHLARDCANRHSGLTYLSTDYVFDGSADGYDEDAARQPIGSYGFTKARGEEAVEVLPDRWQIVRTSWLFGPGPHNFVLTIRRLLAEREQLRVVNDQVGCPTYAPDLAEVLLFLLESGGTGIFHATNCGSCTWFEFAREIARQSGADPERIAPCTTDEYPTPARRPASSILRSRRLEELGCPVRPTWQDALRRYLIWLDSSGVADTH